MCARIPVKCLAALCLAAAILLLSGCAASTAPRYWLSDPEALQEEGYGAWLWVEREDTRIMEDVAVLKLSDKIDYLINADEKNQLGLFRDIPLYNRGHIYRTPEGLYFASVQLQGKPVQSIMVAIREEDLAAAIARIDSSEGRAPRTPGGVETKSFRAQRLNTSPVTYDLGLQDRRYLSRGEFIAVEDSCIYVLSPEGRLDTIPIPEVRKVDLEVFDNHGNTMSAFLALGTLSTLSHGFLLLVSGPTWLITGGIAASGVNWEGHYRETKPDSLWWSSMAMYARFPQGVPEGVTLSNLVVKPRLPGGKKGRLATQP